MHWTADSVEFQVRRAARTLRLMDAPPNSTTPRYRSFWPAVKPQEQDVWFAYARTKVEVGRIHPTNADLDHFDLVLDWFDVLHPEHRPDTVPPDTASIIWARCSHFSWRKIGEMRLRRHGLSSTPRGGRSPVPGGNSRVSLLGIFRRGLEVVARDLNAKGQEEPF